MVLSQINVQMPIFLLSKTCYYFKSYRGSMLSKVVRAFSVRTFRSRMAYRIAIKFVKMRCFLASQKYEFSDARFEAASWVASGKDPSPGYKFTSIELVVVSAVKDFDLLKICVERALDAISEYKLGGVKIIVPFKDMEYCARIFKDFEVKVQIIDENELVTKFQFKKLSKVFAGRDTWMLQQLLKVSAVLTSKSDIVLIIDSDTILLRKRSWLNSLGQQILMPTYEFNPSYYKFLSVLKISDLEPVYTYVSHHMIMKPKIFSQIMESLKFYSLDDLIDYCCAKADHSNPSPVCLEYELYAQYLVNYCNQDFYHGLWANISLPRKAAKNLIHSRLKLRILSKFYNSISFHSWS